MRPNLLMVGSNFVSWGHFVMPNIICPKLNYIPVDLRVILCCVWLPKSIKEKKSVKENDFLIFGFIIKNIKENN